MRCKSPADFGDLTFVINGFEYTLPNDDWVEKNIEYETDGAQLSQSKQSLAQVGPMSMGGFLEGNSGLSPLNSQLSQMNSNPNNNLQT